MHHLRNVWFWPLLALCILESTLCVVYGVLVGVVPLAGSLLLLITLPSSVKVENEHPRTLFYRACGGVALVAIVFVNATHALELLTEKVDAVVSNAADDEEHHHHGHDNEGSFPVSYIIVSIADLLLKAILIVRRKVPRFGFEHLRSVLLFLCTPPLVMLFLALASQVVHLTESYIWEHLNPIATILLSIGTIAMALPYYRQLQPYIFAAAPREFDASFFKRDVYSRFPNVRVAHVHVFRVWPRNSSEALVHLNIQVVKSDPRWPTEAQKTFTFASAFIRDFLHTNVGTTKVRIEPKFVDAPPGTPISAPVDDTFTNCVKEMCRAQGRSCCGGPEKATAHGENAA